MISQCNYPTIVAWGFFIWGHDTEHWDLASSYRSGCSRRERVDTHHKEQHGQTCIGTTCPFGPSLPGILPLTVAVSDPLALWHCGSPALFIPVLGALAWQALLLLLNATAAAAEVGCASGGPRSAGGQDRAKEGEMAV